jgi:hypothetical protein
MSTLSRDQIEQLVKGHHWDPPAVPSLHPSRQNGSTVVVIRSFLPEAREAAVIIAQQTSRPF